MSKNCVRYSKVTSLNGECTSLCAFYSNVACKNRCEADQIEKDLAADAAEMYWSAYVVEWMDNPLPSASV